jgi:hypothetical protein
LIQHRFNVYQLLIDMLTGYREPALLRFVQFGTIVRLGAHRIFAADRRSSAIVAGQASIQQKSNGEKNGEASQRKSRKLLTTKKPS